MASSPPLPSPPLTSPPSPPAPAVSTPTATTAASPPSNATITAPPTPAPPVPSSSSLLSPDSSPQALPRSTLSPAPPGTPSSSSSPTSSTSNSSSTSFIIGISVGGAAVLLICAFLFFCWRWRKRHNRPSKYTGGPPMPLQPPPQKDNFYGGQPEGWQYNVPPPTDHAVTIPSNLPPPPAYASRPPHSPGRFPTSLPPPPVVDSGASGSNHSISEIPFPPSPSIILGFSKSTFNYEELSMATDGFSDANLLGQGGFGYVHKGVLPNGKDVAVKQLKSGSVQGEREFQDEVEIISRVHHRHLVSLVGYYISEDKMLLVYEFVPNKTLEFHLHGKGRPTMEWSTRLKIALGSARGLAYLHEDCHPKIIHHDIKSANILLDFKFEAKVADFGLAKFSSDDNTHVSTQVMGTFGYLAPEYTSTGKLTDKSDVFSFGVVLLELISGRQPVDTTHAFMDDSLVDWARPLLTRALEEGKYDALADPHLQKSYDISEMARMVACAAACVRHSGRRRPRMSQIVRALEGNISLENLNEGIRPGHSSLFSSYGSSDLDSSQYNEDMQKFRKLALSSQEYATTEYSAVTTSEYGQNPSGSSSEVARTRERNLVKDSNDLE